MKKKIAILGGTFNPIHYGHLIMAQSVYLTKQFHEIWLMPAGIPPFKPEEELSKKNRLLMAEIAVKKISYVKVSTLECERAEVSYTYQTLETLHKLYPEYEFWWIIGYDNIFLIETWNEADKLLSNGKFVIMKRLEEDVLSAQKKIQQLQEKYSLNTFFVENPVIEISSGLIRERIQRGEPIDFLVPPKVASYIKKEKLYLQSTVQNSLQKNDAELMIKIKKDLQKVLTSHRYAHTLGVEAAAIKLGKRYGIDTIRLSIAALMHDYAKCMSAKQKRNLCQKYNINISPMEEKNLDLLHAKLGFYIAQDKYGLTDSEILDAIYYHTTGKPEMSDFSKIIYIADAIEEGRGNAEYLITARKLAKYSLNQTMKFLLEESLRYLKKKEKEIDVLSRKAYEYYKNFE